MYKYLENNILFQIICEKKFQVDQHLKTSLHKAKVHKMNSGPIQQSVKSLLENTNDKTRSNEKDAFNQDLCKAFVAANIPLKKLQNQELRAFLQKYCSHNIPDESTLRKKHVHAVYEVVMAEIKLSIKENTFYIAVDESTDACGRYIAHLMIGALKENEPGKPYLISTKELEKTNNVTVSRFIQQSLSQFFLPYQVPVEKFLVLLSDAAPYMVKVGQNLQIFFPNMVHITCLLHGINRVAESIRMEYPLVNKLISNVKKVFLKAPLRVQLYKARLPGVSLPPEPVITRWGTCINAAMFYAEHFDSIKELILEIQDTAQCVVQSQELFKNPAIAQQLVYIKINFSFVPKIISSLETRDLSIRDSIDFVNIFVKKCKDVPGEVGSTINKKMHFILEKNEGFQYLSKVLNKFNGISTEELLTPWPYELLPKLKYCPITSVDVERTFSVSKHMFSDRRQRFLLENFEKYLVINSFYNVSQ